MPSTPHITVAAVIKHDDRYLMVKEQVDGLTVYNQPAGHWEVDETLIEAAIRETQEDTAWNFIPEAVIAIYRWKHPEKNEVYLRVAFSGCADNHQPDQPLDNGILEAVWMTRNEIEALSEIERRSALVLQTIDDYENGKRYDLDMMADIVEVWS
jgi:ADP-ribose pyrophosphatase YjhB (NUDIX family)